MGLFKAAPESFIGVDIGAHGIKLVELRKNKGRPQLWTYGMADRNLDIHALAPHNQHPHATLSSDQMTPISGTSGNDYGTPALEDTDVSEARVEEYAELLKMVVKKSRVSGRRATASLPVSQVFHAIINLPKVDDKMIDGLVQAEIAKMLPLPASDVQIVYQRVPLGEAEQKKYIRLLVTAAPKKIVAFYSTIFSRAGLELQELETEAFAVARSLVGRDQTVSMVVDIGNSRCNFYIVDHGLPMTHRSLEIGGASMDAWLAERLGVAPDILLQMKNDICATSPEALSLEAFSRFLDPIAKEIQYSFDLYLHQSGNEQKRPEKIILTGGAALFPPVLGFMQKTFSLRVFVGDPWARVMYQDRLKPLISDLGPRMSVALGLALRNF